MRATTTIYARSLASDSNGLYDNIIKIDDNGNTNVFIPNVTRYGGVASYGYSISSLDTYNEVFYYSNGAIKNPVVQVVDLYHKNIRSPLKFNYTNILDVVFDNKKERLIVGGSGSNYIYGITISDKKGNILSSFNTSFSAYESGTATLNEKDNLLYAVSSVNGYQQVKNINLKNGKESSQYLSCGNKISNLKYDNNKKKLYAGSQESGQLYRIHSNGTCTLLSNSNVFGNFASYLYEKKDTLYTYDYKSGNLNLYDLKQKENSTISLHNVHGTIIDLAVVYTFFDITIPYVGYRISF